MGDATASGCTAEQMSWTKPGNVSSADRAPPPMVGSASNTNMAQPCWASVIAAAKPLGPEPITMASYDRTEKRSCSAMLLDILPAAVLSAKAISPRSLNANRKEIGGDHRPKSAALAQRFEQSGL